MARAAAVRNKSSVSGRRGAKEGLTLKGAIRLKEIFPKDGPKMLRNRGGIMRHLVTLTPDHVVNLPNRKKKNGPSRRVLFRGLVGKSKKPDNVVAHLEPRSDNPHRPPENPTAREVLKTVTGTTRLAESADDGLTKPGTRGPPITPRANQAHEVTAIQQGG